MTVIRYRWQEEIQPPRQQGLPVVPVPQIMLRPVMKRRPRAYFIEHHVADRFAPAMRRAFVDAVVRSQRHISDLTLPWARGPEAVFGVLPGRQIELDWFDGFRPALLATLQASARAHERHLRIPVRKQGTLGLSLDLTNPRAIRWAEERAAELVVQISEETRAGIRRLIADMFIQGIPPREAARRLRGMLGLTERDMRAVANLQTRLARENAARIVVGRTPVPEERIVDQVDRYGDRLLRNRATVIVRTESIRASAQGQQELWNQARDQGLLDTDFTRRAWLITADELTCPICLPMAATDHLVGLDEPFTGGDGSVVMNPPAHPQCRCATALVFADENGQYQHPQG